jgi:hypothetical protein
MTSPSGFHARIEAAPAHLPALTLGDLQPMAGEPRVRDLRLAEVLGFSNPFNIRKLIRRSEAELALHGEFFSTVEKTHPDTAGGICSTVEQNHGGRRGGRPGTEYWLNEPQAVLICLFARTARAAEVRRQVITVFLAWRQGALIPAAPAPAAPTDRFTEMERRLAAIEALVRFEREVAPDGLAVAVTHLPVWSNGRRPRFWNDVEVRALLTRLHRQTTMKDALAICRREFGDERTPSRPTLCRYWQRLDRARGGLS